MCKLLLERRNWMHKSYNVLEAKLSSVDGKLKRAAVRNAFCKLLEQKIATDDRPEWRTAAQRLVEAVRSDAVKEV